jgi:hypothetical protein
MTMLESTLVTYLESNTSAKYYPLEKPQTVTIPVVVYKRISTLQTKSHNSKPKLNRVRIGLTFWGSSYSDLKVLANTVKGLLEGNTTNFDICQFIDQADFKDISANLYQIYQEYFIWSNDD